MFFGKFRHCRLSRATHGISLALLAAGCAAGGGGGASGGATCTDLTNAASWTPTVSGSGNANHVNDTTKIEVTQDAPQTLTGVPITGLAVAATAAKEVTLTIPMTSDLGAYGSITLQAEVQGYPLAGSGYPVLVSLVDNNGKDWVNLKRAGAGSDCAQSGFYTCAGSSCTANASCTVQAPSAYQSRRQWDQHNVSDFSTYSVNTFPTCKWTDAASGGNFPACAFNSDFFVGGKLPFGGAGTVYTAKYVILADSCATAATSGCSSLATATASLKVTVVRKKNTLAVSGNATNGALDLNVILVGNNNVNASRSAAGQRNLNTLLKTVQDYFNVSAPGPGLKLGKITAIEFPCQAGGGSYSTLSYGSLGTLFKLSSTLAAASSEGKAVNLFLVDSVTDGSSSGLTILGVSGGIRGSPLLGSPMSGVVVSTQGVLETYNPNCTVDPCTPATQTKSFHDMSGTIAHEIGHYLGLNHPSESAGTRHDAVFDTPICTNTTSVGGTSYIMPSSCQSAGDSNVQAFSGSTCNAACTAAGGRSCSGFGIGSCTSACAAVAECQFNHSMWWTTKGWTPATDIGDGNLYSTYSSILMNYSSLVQ